MDESSLVSRPRGWRIANMVMGLITVAGVALVDACASANKPLPGVVTKSFDGKTVMNGTVFRVVGKDSVPVTKAEVWTEPISDLVYTDSLGYWEIRDGIVDSRYRVRAKFDGVSGQSSIVDLKPGTDTKILIVLGEQETSWPPSLALDNKASVLPKGPNRTRPGGQ